METNGNGAQNGSSHGRTFQAVKEGLGRSILNVRRPADFVAVLIYGVPIYSTIRICIEAGIFTYLAKAGEPLTAVQIAEQIGKTLDDKQQEDSEGNLKRRDFVVRNLRVVCALGMVDETAAFTYQANELTLALADPGLSAGISQVYHGVMGPRSTMAQMYHYHKSNGWKASDTALDGPYQRAHEIVGMSTFDHWVNCDPEQMSRLNHSMHGMQENFTHWLEWFPRESLFTKEASSKEIFMVDVGGGYGHDVSALAAKYPEEQFRTILQDLPGVLEEGENRRQIAGHKLDSRITRTPHDFFQKQPIQYAGIYYMHKIMHDWPDKDCVRILNHIRDAMAPDSKIFINDCILLNRDCPLRPAIADIAMLAMHSGKERDEEMWTRLLSKVEGLTIRKFWHCPDDTGEGIVEIVRG